MIASSCNVCGAPASNKCAACGTVAYCGREHQRHDWRAHKLACQEFQSMRAKGQAWESDIKNHEYSGTYRWSQKTDFPSLGVPAGGIDLSGWESYLGTRLPDDGTTKLVADVAMLDSLSFPMSFVFAMRLLLHTNGDVKDWLFRGVRDITIAALGTSERAEEHVLRHTDYFQEISFMMPSFKIQLWLVGPEMSKAGHGTSTALGEKMTATCFRGTFADWAAEQEVLHGGGALPAKTIVIAYNSGMASGDAALKVMSLGILPVAGLMLGIASHLWQLSQALASWRADVRRLLRYNLLSVLTCANDHSDLKCEKELMASLRANYMLKPCKNAFSAVTTLHPPGRKETAWYCANAYIYAVQGCASGAPATGKPQPSANGRSGGQKQSLGKAAAVGAADAGRSTVAVGSLVREPVPVAAKAGCVEPPTLPLSSLRAVTAVTDEVAGLKLGDAAFEDGAASRPLHHEEQREEGELHLPD